MLLFCLCVVSSFFDNAKIRIIFELTKFSANFFSTFYQQSPVNRVRTIPMEFPPESFCRISGEFFWKISEKAVESSPSTNCSVSMDNSIGMVILKKEEPWFLNQEFVQMSPDRGKSDNSIGMAPASVRTPLEFTSLRNNKKVRHLKRHRTLIFMAFVF